MAKRVNLQQALHDPDDGDNAAGADKEQKSAPAKKTAPAKKSASKRTGGKSSATKKATTSKKTASGRQATTKKAGAAAKKSPASAEQGSRRREPVQVKGVKVSEAKRVSLYVHPDDYDWMKYELRGGDLQAVLRSMIAVCRHDPRLAERVARYSRTAPRGEH